MKNPFFGSVSRVFRGALSAAVSFPSAILCAFCFAVIAVVRVRLDWEQEVSIRLLLVCMQWALAFGSAFSLAAVAAAKSRSGTTRASAISNILGGLAAVVMFLLLNFSKAAETDVTRYAHLSYLSSARCAAAVFVSLTAFVIFAQDRREHTGFAPALFMAIKAFFIALIYGLVICGGVIGIAASVKSLIYRDMSEKVYMYILITSCFIAFSVFAGNFPDFADPNGEKRAQAEKQPRFIEVLFNYILVPIVMVLTVVLFIWAGKTVIGGMKVKLFQLSAIAAAYTIGGLWLAAMVDRSSSKTGRFYRRVYPAASIVILAFEAWAVINSLLDTGLKIEEYIFILIWIVAAAGALLLLFLKSKAHTVIAIIVCFLAIVAVLPGAGYQALPVACQSKRLETLLTGQGMLENGRIIPAESEPLTKTREDITDSVLYLANAGGAKLPDWFEKDMAQSGTFKKTFGFEMTWGTAEYEPERTYAWADLSLKQEAVDISGYAWAINPKGSTAQFVGERGTYRVFWSALDNGVPSIRIELNGQAIIEEDLSAYLEELAGKYLTGTGGGELTYLPLEDMSHEIVTDKLRLLLVFNYIGVSRDAAEGTISYRLDISAAYAEELP